MSKYKNNLTEDKFIFMTRVNVHTYTLCEDTSYTSGKSIEIYVSNKALDPNTMCLYLSHSLTQIKGYEENFYYVVNLWLTKEKEKVIIVLSKKFNLTKSIEKQKQDMVIRGKRVFDILFVPL